jgi:hypothetical protein
MENMENVKLTVLVKLRIFSAGPFGVGVIYLYFIIGTIINKILISPLSKWSARVELNEGNFRYMKLF